MHNLISFLKSRAFFFNVGAGLLLIVVLFWLFIKFLDFYTNHGESVTVPSFKGFKIEELDEFASSHNLKYVIIDSIYDLKKERGTVAEQIPSPESQVKEGRAIYLTVVSKKREMKRMPNLVDATLRQAIAIMETYGLKTGKLRYKPAECVKCVLDVEYKGKSIEPGTLIENGSKIDLVLGRGKSGEMVPVPILLNLTLVQAQELLKSKALDVGAVVVCENCLTKEDSSIALVFKQNPAYYRDNMINLGKAIDLYLTLDSSKLRFQDYDTTIVMDSNQTKRISDEDN